MTTTHPAGFTAAGVAAGLKSTGAKDLALEKGCSTIQVAAGRRQKGAAGRRRFGEFFNWEAVLHRHYRALLHAAR